MLNCFGIMIMILTANTNADPPLFTKTPYPKIAMLWSPIRGDNSIESIAKHDLILLGTGSLGLKYNRSPIGFADGFTSESIETAKQRLSQIRKINPYAVIFCELYFYEWSDQWLPEDHPWWLRVNGKREQFWPGTYRMNWYDPEYRHLVVKWASSLKETGIDGVFFDNIRNEPEPWIAFLKEVRQAIGDNFLILANAGYNVGDYDFIAPYLNGIMYESGWSHNRTEWDEIIKKMQNTEKLLRSPNVSLIERFEDIRSRAGWPNDPKRGQKPQPDPSARRWSLCFSLIIGNYYYLFSDNTSHKHDWYPEYDIKIGQPIETGKRINTHVWQRQYEDAIVIVNLPGAKMPYTIRLKGPAKDSLTGEVNNSFVVPAGDGRIIIGGELD